MKIAAATDFAGSTGDPELALRALAEGGFSSLHWCHHWNDDYIYMPSELVYYRSLLKKYNLTLLDIHGTDGREKRWASPDENQRRAGVEIVTNRIEMLDYLNATGTLMMHMPSMHFKREEMDDNWIKIVNDSYAALLRTFDELMPVLEKYDRLIAVENMWSDSWELMEDLWKRYPKNRIGLCYDSGHANNNANKRIDSLEKNKDRLEALHLHDNDGESDQHQPPFYGTVDWERLAKLIATSSYTREISFEMAMVNTPFYLRDAEGNYQQQSYDAMVAFAKDAFERCSRFANMVEAAR